MAKDENIIIVNGRHYVTKYSERRQRKFWYCKNTKQTTWTEPVTFKRKRDHTTSSSMDDDDDDDDNNTNADQLVEQINTLTCHKLCLESKVIDLQRDADRRDIDDLKTALNARTAREKEEDRLLNKIKVLESKNDNLLDKNLQLESKVKGLKIVLEHRSKRIADFEQVAPTTPQ